jgi:hypothetical protein
MRPSSKAHKPVAVTVTPHTLAAAAAHGQVVTAVAGLFASRRHKKNAKRRCLAHAQTSRPDAPDLRTEDSVSVQNHGYLPQK